MIYFPGEKIMIFEISAYYYEFCLFGVGCCCWKTLSSAKTIPALTPNLAIANGWIINYSIFYGAGNRPEDLYFINSKSTIKPAYKVSFIHNFDPAGNNLIT